MSLNLFANRFHRRMRPQKAVRKRLVLTQQAEQQVLCLNVRRAKLACFVTREKYHAPRLFCIAFEHVPPQTPTAVALRLLQTPALKPEHPATTRRESRVVCH